MSFAKFFIAFKQHSLLQRKERRKKRKCKKIQSMRKRKKKKNTGMKIQNIISPSPLPGSSASVFSPPSDPWHGSVCPTAVVGWVDGWLQTTSVLSVFGWRRRHFQVRPHSLSLHPLPMWIPRSLPPHLLPLLLLYFFSSSSWQIVFVSFVALNTGRKEGRKESYIMERTNEGMKERMDGARRCDEKIIEKKTTPKYTHPRTKNHENKTSRTNNEMKNEMKKE